MDQNDRRLPSTSFKLPANDDTKMDHFFKIVILGDAATGKTAIQRRFLDDQFSDTMVTSIGVDFKVQNVLCCGKGIKLQIWDTAGQERFRAVNAPFLRDTVGVIFVYSVTKKETIGNLKYWMKMVHDILPPEVVKVMVGNKCDVSKQDRQIPKMDGMRIANQFGFTFFETSAKSAENVEAVFKTMTSQILEKSNLVEWADEIQERKTIKIQQVPFHKKRRSTWRKSKTKKDNSSCQC